MKFLSPKGAVKDAKELEYLVALHQTTHAEIEEFRNGSIDDEDVRVFLMSQFGIKITNEQVREYIFKGLAGGDGEGEAMDILELVAILMIPMLVKVSEGVLGPKKRTSTLSADQQRLLPPETIIADVLQDILADTTDGKSSTSRPPLITPLLLKQIFVQYDELDLVTDDALIDDMIAVASSGKTGASLDVAAFARALSTDVQLYDPENETRYTEIFTDVFPDGIDDDDDTDDEDDDDAIGDKKPIKKVKMLSHMDYTADTFVHSMHVSMLWLVIVFSYFFYMLGVQGADWLQSDKDGFGYKVGYAVLRWTVTMLKLVIIGGIFGFFLGLGNGLPQTFFISPILGLIAIACLVFLPAFYKGDTIFFDTDLENSEHEEWAGLGYLLVFFGVILVLLQFKNLFDYFMPSFEHSKVYAVIDGIAGSSTQRAYRSKQAGIFKINQLVKNAYDLHKLDDKSQEREPLKSEKSNNSSTKHTSSKAIALQNYADQVDELEEVGGVLWAAKEYFTGRMAGTEGIWLPSRLLAANAIQFFAIIVCVTAASVMFRDLIDGFYPKELPNEVVYSDSCFATFDYDNCYFPFEDRGAYVGVGVCRQVSIEGPECYDLFEPLNSTDGLDGLIGSTCMSLEAAFQKVEAEVSETLLGANCSQILGAAREFAISEADTETSPDEIEFIINRCYGVNTMTADDIDKYNEWFDDDQAFPDITNETLEVCQLVGEYVKTDAFSDLAPGFEDSAFEAFRMCMSAYGSIAMEGPCENDLYSPREEVVVYEQDYDGDDYCVTFISACYIDPFKPTRATCIIGETDDILYQFEGPTCKNYPQINNTLVFYEENVLPQELSVARFFPEKWTLYMTAIISIVTGTIVAIITTAVYIPSAIHTVLKFRSGVIPSLKDPYFLKYRSGLVNQTYMIGSMFWGLVVTTAMVTILVAIVTFLLVWPASRDIVINLCAQVLGIVVTILLKMVLCMIFLKTAYAGFYRKMPAFANAFMFAMECWHIALTVAYVLSRLVKFLLATGLYVGRIDRPVLAEGLALDVDSLPKIFRQNLLSAEAHRHPYMVQLGQMYLMKLRHKNDFGTKAGSIWRLLFVSALMPWLRKKRIQDEVDLDGEIASSIRNSFAQQEPERNLRRISRASFQIEP